MMLMKLISEQKPEYMAAACDLPAPTFRHRVFPEYKANRSEMPDRLKEQIPVVKKVISLMRIPIFEIEGYEADDILGTLSKQAEEHELIVYILSPDKDFLQLITPRVKVLRQNKGYVTYDVDRVINRFGIKPPQLVDLWALSGDASDNIPGVPGIGEKRAAGLIQEFGSLDNVLNNTEKVENVKIKENLRKFSGLARLSKQLVTIDCNVPFSFDYETCAVKEPDREGLRKLFNELELKKMLAMIQDV